MDMSAKETCGRATNFNRHIAFVTEQGQGESRSLGARRMPGSASRLCRRPTPRGQPKLVLLHSPRSFSWEPDTPSWCCAAIGEVQCPTPRHSRSFCEGVSAYAFALDHHRLHSQRLLRCLNTRLQPPAVIFGCLLYSRHHLSGLCIYTLSLDSLYQ